MRTVDEWKALLRTELRTAMKARNTDAVTAIRDTLAAIDNAEAADLSTAPAAHNGTIAGAVSGLGAGDVARKVLDGAAVTAIVDREIEERRAAITTYEAAGKREHAEQLRSGLAALEALR